MVAQDQKARERERAENGSRVWQDSAEIYDPDKRQHSRQERLRIIARITAFWVRSCNVTMPGSHDTRRELGTVLRQYRYTVGRSFQG